MIDAAIQYESFIKLIEFKVRHLSDEHTKSVYSAYIENIKDSTNETLEEIKNKYTDKIFRKAFVEQMYQGQTVLVKKLISDLEMYDIYENVISKCDILRQSMNGENIDSSTVDGLVQNAIEYLKALKTSPTLPYDEEKKSVDYLAKTVSELTELEIVNNGSTKLLDYCKNDITMGVFVSEYIEKKAKEESLKNQNVQSRLQHLENSNFESLYLDKELIVLMNNKKTVKQISDKLLSQVNQMNTELNENLNNIMELKCEKILLEDEYKNGTYKNSFSEAENISSIFNIGKNVVSIVGNLLVSAALVSSFVGCFVGANAIIKNKYEKEVYDTEIVDIDSRDGQIQKSNEFLEQVSEKGNTESTIAKYYSQWRATTKGYTRTVHEYDLSKLNYDNLEDLLNMDAERNGTLVNTYEETEKTLTEEELTESEHFEIYNYNQDFTEYKLDYLNNSEEIKAIVSTILLGIAFSLGELLLLIKPVNFINENFDVRTIKELINIIKIEINSIKRHSKDKEKLEDTADKLYELTAQIDELILKNDDIKRKYEELMKDNSNVVTQYEDAKACLNTLKNELDKSDEIKLTFKTQGAN